MEKPSGKFAIAWYKSDQWDQLREVSEDRDVLEADYEAWRQFAEERIQDLESRGIQIEKVLVDVYELSRWCQDKKVKCNGEARSKYAAEQAREQNEPT